MTRLRRLQLLLAESNVSSAMSQDRTPITVAGIVQPRLRVAIPRWLSWHRGLSGRAATEDIEMFARKGVFSSIGRDRVMATVAALALTAVEPSLALAGSAPAARACRRHPAPAAPPTSAPGAGIIAAAVVPPRRGLCRDCRHRACDRRDPEPPRLLSTIMPAAPSITGVVRPTTAASPYYRGYRNYYGIWRRTPTATTARLVTGCSRD